MNRKILFLPLLLLAMMVRAEVGLTLEALDGRNMQYAVSLIGQIRFADNAMCLYDKSGAELGCTPVAEIGRIVFKDGISTSSGGAEGSCIAVYPDAGSIVVRGAQSGQTVRVYDMQGRLMSAVTVGSGAVQIPVSGLQNGAYLLQVGAEVVKFVKQ